MLLCVSVLGRRLRLCAQAGAYATTRRGASCLDPAVLLASVCTMIVTATSMVANDYFDFVKGTDSDDEGNVLARKASPPPRAPRRPPAHLERFRDPGADFF